MARVAKTVSPGVEFLSVTKGLDIVGDIATLRFPYGLSQSRYDLAEALLRELPSVRVVLSQPTPVKGEYRIRELEWLAGEKRTSTIHREYGCSLKVDLAKVYFSPRLSYERMRVANLVRERELRSGAAEAVVNMFAGVGCFSILIARNSQFAKIYSIDINQEAVRHMMENIRLNKVRDRVEAILGDAKQIVASHLAASADRVLMPLPEKAYEYLEAAVRALRPRKGVIHFYEFIHARKEEDPARKLFEKASEKMGKLGVDFRLDFSRIVRTVGPNWYQVALDILVNKRT